jgi:hypothetical protein
MKWGRAMEGPESERALHPGTRKPVCGVPALASPP